MCLHKGSRALEGSSVEVRCHNPMVKSRRSSVGPGAAAAAAAIQRHAGGFGVSKASRYSTRVSKLRAHAANYTRKLPAHLARGVRVYGPPACKLLGKATVRVLGLLVKGVALGAFVVGKFTLTALWKLHREQEHRRTAFQVRLWFPLSVKVSQELLHLLRPRHRPRLNQWRQLSTWRAHRRHLHRCSSRERLSRLFPALRRLLNHVPQRNRALVG